MAKSAPGEARAHVPRGLWPGQRNISFTATLGVNVPRNRWLLVCLIALSHQSRLQATPVIGLDSSPVGTDRTQGQN